MYIQIHFPIPKQIAALLSSLGFKPLPYFDQMHNNSKHCCITSCLEECKQKRFIYLNWYRLGFFVIIIINIFGKDY